MDGARNKHANTKPVVNTLPFQRNLGFFGRESILNEIEKQLRLIADSPQVRSVAMWGIGGIGKSHIALEFAHRRWLTGNNVVLWISSETDAEIAKSFNDAAARLQLPSYQNTNTPDQNRWAVLQWLQDSTDTPWLLVLDNVVNQNWLLDIWPVTGAGSILITCQSELLAESPAATSIEIPAFNKEEGGELVLRILNRKNISQDEVSAAQELSEKLGGLALLVDIVAKQIKMTKRFKNIRDFLTHYEEHYRDLNKRPRLGIVDPYYSKDGDTVWQTAFKTLGTNAARLLSLFCFVAPEGIPQWLLEQKDVNLPPGWEFLSSFQAIDEAELELRNFSLMRINEETGLIFLHLRTQAAYFDRMGKEQREDAFKATLPLLRKAFPGRTGQFHLYNRWQICEQLRQHTLAFQARYQIMLKDGFSEQDESFTRLMCDTAWYLLEIQSFRSCEQTLKLVEKNTEDKTSLIYAYVCTNFVSLYERTGRSVRAIPNAEKALWIRQNENTDKNDLANGYSDVGYSSVAAYQAKEGLKNLEEALGIAAETPKPERHTIYNVDRFLRNHGRGNMLLGRFDEASKDFDRAVYFQPLIHGPNSHYDGEVMYERAKIARVHKKDLNLAYELCERAYDLMSPGKPTHSSVMAIHYQKGLVCSARGDSDSDIEAIQHFRNALTICQLNEAQRGNQGESARVKWRLSQVLERQG
ncbi:MAG: hypothetical protein Q9214_004731 [Letrouitia sp. 1 TL-2023]